jgi:hypothetical protein
MAPQTCAPGQAALPLPTEYALIDARKAYPAQAARADRVQAAIAAADAPEVRDDRRDSVRMVLDAFTSGASEYALEELIGRLLRGEFLAGFLDEKTDLQGGTMRVVNELRRAPKTIGQDAPAKTEPISNASRSPKRRSNTAPSRKLVAA